MVEAMKFVYITLLVHSAQSVRFRVNVDYFDLKFLDDDAKKQDNTHDFRTLDDEQQKPINMSVESSVEDTKREKEDNIVFEKELVNSDHEARATSVVTEHFDEKKNWTAGFGERCLYQYPDEEQVNSMLSAMMYHLIKIFLEANEIISHEVAKRSREMPNAEGIRRALLSRFEVGQNKRRTFFSNIYKNLTTNIKRFYGNKIEKQASEDRDSCPQLEKIKKSWHPLLRTSLVTFKRVLRHCVQQYLKDHKIDPNTKLGMTVKAHFHNHMMNVKSKQLKMLCDDHNVCD